MKLIDSTVLNDSFLYKIYRSLTLIYIFTQPIHHKQNVTQGLFLSDFSRFEFRISFSMTSCHTKVKELSFPYYLPITRG